MLVAVSPYHLTTREAPAMAALLLAERVVTMLPAPEEESAGRKQAAAGKIPSYLAFMKTWSWTVPLWKAGVIVTELDGQTAVADMQAVSGRVGREEHLAPLRHFMHTDVFDNERAYLAAVAADMLKGGPDPGISVPVAAGMDRFATRHQILVARPQPVSVVQVAEAKMGEGLESVAVPVLLQADADRIIHARDVLADVLEPLWSAYENLNEADQRAGHSVAAAATAYARAFEERRENIFDGSEEDEVRVVEGTVTIAAMRMPSDVVLRSSLAAVTRLGVRAPAASEESCTANVPAVFDPLAGRTFTTLLIKPLGARPARRR